MHYLIIIVIIAVIVIIQLRFFIDTKLKINIFLWIFPAKSDEYKLSKDALIEKINSAKDEDLKKMLANSGFDREKYCYSRINTDGIAIDCFRREQARKDLINVQSATTNSISVSRDNKTLKTIVDSINNYLKNNKSVSDFHLMKDIVDRNCDAKEEEISTQIPIPLYMGLVGTMAGILIGILYLWLSGGIGDLLNARIGSGADGVEALLGGVALAMISSILGIMFTTWSSIKFKTAKSVVESDKHVFLSWIQAKLLPTLSDNVVGTIREMVGNLTEFNKAFSDNTSNLGEALAKVNESYELQTKLIDAVNKIQEGRTAATNLALLSKLIESSKQIGKLAEYLHNTSDYLANVKALNEKLDKNENRTRTIEEIGIFFKTELEQIDARKGVISKAVGIVDDYLKQALEKLKENAEAQFNELQKSTVKQQNILQRKAEEINILVSELQKLESIKDSISKFEKAMNAQNGKLDNLANAIQALAKAKVEGTDIPTSTFQPVWKKILIWTGSIIGGLLLLALLIANWDSIYRFLRDIFRI